MANSTSTSRVAKTETAVGVFDDPQDAQQAVHDLRAAGFTDDQIGVVSRNNAGSGETAEGVRNSSTDPGNVAAASAAAGAGAGALWGLGILAGVLPGIGPAIAGGTLGVLLSSAAAGAAAAAGLGVVLVSLGVSEDDAEYYEREFTDGRTIVTVRGTQSADEAHRILSRNGGYNRQSRSDL